MSPASRFFKKAGRSVSSFFKKGIAGPVQKLFAKNGAADLVVHGLSNMLGVAGGEGSSLAKNPYITKGLDMLSPLVGVPLTPLLTEGSKGMTLASNATDFDGRRPLNMKQQQNPLEIAKTQRILKGINFR
jgi:hypothetical protein